MTELRVAVVGGGVGGLCLAQGLHRDGVDVTVYERDATPVTRGQGYRIHLDARADRALRACLPPPLYAVFRATVGIPGTAVSVVDQRLKLLHRMPVGSGVIAGVRPDGGVRLDGGARLDGAQPSADGADRAPLRSSAAGLGSSADQLSAPADRQTLREVLSAGLDGILVYGREFIGFEEMAGPPGRLRLRFADGSTEQADVLVGADGVNSRVRRQYLPHARVTDTGTRCLYGKTLLTDETLPLVPPVLFDGFTAVVGGGTVGMAAALVRFRERPDVAARRLRPGTAVTPVPDYLMWAVTARVADEHLVAGDGATLHRLARDAIAGWHPDLRALVDRAEAAATFAVRIRTAEPVPAWPASRVTLIGDAIHVMSPNGGSGANTALTDASILCRELVAAVRGEKALPAAIAAYEDRMREYGFAAVAAAAVAAAAAGMRDTWGRRHPVLSRIARLLGR